MAKTYIVDGNSLLFRAYYSTAVTGNLMTNKDGIPTNAVFAFHNLMKTIKSRVQEGDHLFVAFDAGGPTFRKQEFEDYKAQRHAAPQELVCQMPIARELLDSMSINWKELKGYEGDDLAGSMARYAASLGDEVRLFTSDKDFLQLLEFSDNITVEMLKKGLSETICYTKSNLKELFGLNPDQIIDFKGMAGDNSDNYKGIKGVGEKTAMKLLDQYGHLEQVLEYCKSDLKPKINQKIVEGEKDALFFKELARIETTLDMKEEYEKSKYAKYKKSVLMAFYVKYQLHQFMKAIDRLPGLIDDMNRQTSLFDIQSEDQDNKAEVKKEREIKYIDSFSKVNETPLCLTFDSVGDNENTADLISFIIGTENFLYILKKDNAMNDEAFIDFVQHHDENLAVYDQKSLMVHLNRIGLPELGPVNFDLLIALYLINPDFGQKKEDLFFASGLAYDRNQNLSYKAAELTIDLRQDIEKQLKTNNETMLFHDVELKLSCILAHMEIEGFPIDLDTLSTINIEYAGILNSLQNQIYDSVGSEFNINSPRQLEKVLFEDLGIQRRKGEKGTGIEVLTAHAEDHPVIPLIIKYRLYSKLVSGYTSSLPEHVLEDGKIHSIYNQALTATGRLSMSEPNLQNISIRNEEGKNIRKAFFYPNKEYYFLSLDYSQIELRMLAHVANIEALKTIFNEGQDIHRATAAKVFHVPFDEVTDDMRRKAKAVNFGIVYGISAYGLSEQLSIPTCEAKELIAQFKEAFVGIEEFQKSCIERAKKEGYVSTILNRRRCLKDINSSNHALRAFSERAAVNTVIQGSAADLIKVAMIKCDEVLKNYKSKIILQIHDELLFKVPKDEINIVTPLLKKAMEEAIRLTVPLEANGNYALTWYEAH